MATIDWSNPAFTQTPVNPTSSGIDWSNPAFMAQPAGQPQPTPAPSPSAGNRFLKSMAGYPARVASDVSSAVKQGNADIQKNASTASSNASPLKKFGSAVQTGLNVAGDVTGAIASPITEAVAPAVGAIANTTNPTSLGDRAVGAVEGALGGLAKKYPTAARDVGDVANIATLPLGDAGAGLAKGTAEDVIKNVTDTTGNSATKNASKVLDLVTPQLSKGQIEDAISSGLGKVDKITGKVKIAADSATQRAAEAVKDIVKPGKTVTENINRVRQGIADEANKLKSSIESTDHPYTFTELASRLKSVPKPILISTDTALNNAFDKTIDATLDIAKKNGGKVSSLLDTRKEFDQLAKSQFPNVFDDAKSGAMQSAVKGIRNEINNFIAENAPDAGVKESLSKQSSMYDAIDNMSTKVSQEVGTNKWVRGAQNFARKHPIASTLGAAVAGTIITNEAGKVASGVGDVISSL